MASIPVYPGKLLLLWMPVQIKPPSHTHFKANTFIFLMLLHIKAFLWTHENITVSRALFSPVETQLYFLYSCPVARHLCFITNVCPWAPLQKPTALRFYRFKWFNQECRQECSIAAHNTTQISCSKKCNYHVKKSSVSSLLCLII